LDYSGSVTDYAKNTSYNGANQSLLLGITHELTQRISLSLRENAGEFYRNYGMLGLSQTATFDPSSGYTPLSDFYDNRTIYVSTQADVTIQKSAHLSFNMGGDAFLNRRRSSALYGVTGAGARGDVQYRMSKRTTVGAGYTYTKYKFRGIFSGTDVHNWVATYGIRLTQRFEISLYGGAAREETKFVQAFALDPAIRALLGLTYRAAIVHLVDYLGTYNARVSYTMRRGVASVSGSRAVTPGNGLFLTSTSTNYTAEYVYTGLRFWSFSAMAGYLRSKSIGNVLGMYGGTSGTATASRQLWGIVHAVASFSARQYSSPSFQNYNRLIYTARLGLGVTPGDIPLRIW
jgi:hypothetical protein